MNIGNAGSGTRGTWEVMEEALGWTRDDLKLATEMKSAETGSALCDDFLLLAGWSSFSIDSGNIGVLRCTSGSR